MRTLFVRSFLHSDRRASSAAHFPQNCGSMNASSYMGVFPLEKTAEANSRFRAICSGESLGLPDNENLASQVRICHGEQVYLVKLKPNGSIT